MNIVNRRVADLKINPRNARRHSAAQVGQIATSIRRFGFNNPILLDAESMILAGHGRFEAAKVLGLEVVPTVELRHLSESEKRAYVIADNRLAELAGWDREILAIEFEELLECEADFEVTDLGFTVGEIDVLLAGGDGPDEPDPADEVGPFLNGIHVSEPGDVWQVGDHRLLCGDALNSADYVTLMGGDLAEMAFADPPYNVPINGHVSGLGRVQHREFVMGAGEMTEGEFTRFLSASFRHMARWTTDGSIHFVCMDWRHLQELLRAGRIAFSELKNVCVWVKTNGGMGSLYRSQHELIAVFKSGSGAHINNVELGQNGRNRTNVWHYAGLNCFQSERAEKLTMHPTVKPVALIADAILDCSRRRGIVLDPFAGSGSTIIAAQRTGRRAYCIELDPTYVDVALRRVRASCGIEPIHGATGDTFSGREEAAALAVSTELRERAGE